jgi:hypothetical protein
VLKKQRGCKGIDQVPIKCRFLIEPSCGLHAEIAQKFYSNRIHRPFDEDFTLSHGMLPNNNC